MSGRRLRARRPYRSGPAAVVFLLCLAGCAAVPGGKTEVRTLRGIDLTHTSVVEQVGEEDPDIVVAASDRAVADVLAEQGLRLYFCRKDAPRFTKVIMGAAGSPTHFLASIPHHPRGTWIDYYIEVRGRGGELLTFPGTAGEGIYYSLRFTGEVPPLVSALHEATLFIALLLFLVAAALGGRFVKGSGSYGKMTRCIGYGLALLILGGGPLAALVGYYRFDAPGAVFSATGDVTHAKILVLILYWLVVAVLCRIAGRGGESVEGGRVRCARLAIAGAALTAIVYVLPHGI